MAVICIVKSLPNLLKKINEWNTGQVSAPQWHDQDWQAQPILHSFNTTGEADDPYMFGPGVFDDDFKTILSLMPDYQTRDAMQGIAQKLSKSPRNLQKIEKLKNYLDELDQRRNTNWRTVFPWLEEFADVV